MGDLSVPCAQWFRSANNVFEHRVALDLFSQRQIFVPRSLFRPDAVINVGARCIPSSNLSALVSKRIVLSQEPTVLAVLPERPILEFERKTTRQGSLPFEFEYRALRK